MKLTPAYLRFGSRWSVAFDPGYIYLRGIDVDWVYRLQGWVW